MLTKRYRLWQPLHIVGAVFVLAYVFFQVLDLDLSSFPLNADPAERTAILTEASETTELSNTISEDSFRLAPLPLQPFIKESIGFPQKTVLNSPALRREITIHLHRFKIPGFSDSDYSPAA